MKTKEDLLSPDVRLYLYLCLTFAVLWGTIELIDLMRAPGALSLEERLLLALRTPHALGIPLGPGWLTRAALDITALGGYAVLIIMVTLVSGYLLLHRKTGAALFVIAASVSGHFVSHYLKQIIERPRPALVPHLVETGTYSFPSGHAMLSAVVYLTLASLIARVEAPRSVRLYVVLAGVGLTMLIGLSRVFLGVHYLSDVLGGWIAGLLWASGCSVAAAWLQKRGAVEPSSE